MIGTPEYGKYVPNNVSPQRLSRDFLLAVSGNNITILAHSLCTTRLV